MAADFRVIGEVDIDADKAQKGLDGLQNLVKNLGIAALFAQATEAAIDLGKAIIDIGSNYESSMAKVKTLFTGTSQEFQDLSADLLDISMATGQSAQTLAEAAYSAESAGVAQEDLANLIMASSKLAVAGFTDVDTALSATAKTMNAYGMQGEQSIEKVQKVLMQTQNLGITTVGELGDNLAKVTPTAAAFGVSIEQVGASLAGMTAQGTPTAQATTQLNALLSELGKTGTTASDNLKAAAEGSEWAGMSFKEMMASGATLNDVLDLMSAYADQNGLSMVDMFSSIEAGKAALSLDSTDFIANLEAMSTEADVVGEGFDTMAQTFDMSMERVKTGAETLAIEIYQSLQTNLTGLAQMAADSITTLVQVYREQGLGGMLAAIGEMILQAIPKLITGLAEMITKAATWLSTTGRGEVTGGGDNAIAGLVEAVAAALPDLLWAVGNLILQAVGAIIRQIPSFLSAGAQIIGGLISGLVSGAWGIVQALLQPLIDAWNNITNFGWSGLGGNIIGGIVNGLWAGAGAIWNALSSVVSNAWHGVLSWLGIRSPSRRARDEIGKNVMLGISAGFDEDTTAEEAITKQAQNIIDTAQAELDRAHWQLGSTLIDTNATTEQRLAASWTGESTTIIELDGHELARASAPYLDEQLAFEGV